MGQTSTRRPSGPAVTRRNLSGDAEAIVASGVTNSAAMPGAVRASSVENACQGPAAGVPVSRRVRLST